MKILTQLPVKKLLRPFALLLCLGTIVSCSKKEATIAEDPKPINPISDYTVTPDAVDGFTFTFTNTGKDYTKVEWRFGDGNLDTAAKSTSYTYPATGLYTADLMTYSKTGNISHKYIDVNVTADNIVQVTTEKTATPYQLKFGLTAKANIKSVLWTFNAVNPSTNVTTTTTSTEMTPVTSFAFGSFNNFSVKITTDKGSEAVVQKDVTTDGVVTDITQTRVAYNSTNENTVQGPNEGSLKLVDGNDHTKFGFYSAFPKQQIATLQFGAPVTVKMYAIENGNDSESRRDPKEWYLEGSDDGNTWEALDHQTLTIGFADYLTSIGQASTRYYRFFYYPIAEPKPYTYYRWKIVSVFGTAFQIMEFRLYK